MRTQLIIALLAATMQARSSRSSSRLNFRQDERDHDEDHDEDVMDVFINLASKFNKHFSTTEEVEERLRMFEYNYEKVALLNEKNRNTGVRFAMNSSFDLSAEEFQ